MSIGKMSRGKLPGILKIAQSHSMNMMKGAWPNMKNNRLNKDKNYTVEIKDGHFLMDYKYDKNNCGYRTRLAIPDHIAIKKMLIEETFQKFFVFIHYKFNEDGLVSKFSSKEFLEFLGKEPTYKAIEKINDKLGRYCKSALTSIKLWWESNPRTRCRDTKGVVPFYKAEIKRGTITIAFESNYADSLKDSYYNLPKVVGALSEDAFLAADFIYTYARKAKTGTFYLTMETLYKKLGLPSLDEVKDTYSRNATRAIKEPIYKALSELEDTLNEITTYNVILEEEILESDKLEDFLMTRVKFTITGTNYKGIQKQFDKKKKDDGKISPI